VCLLRESLAGNVFVIKDPCREVGAAVRIRHRLDYQLYVLLEAVSAQIHRVNHKLAPAYYVVAAAIVSLLTILTIRETAGRSLSQGVADEMFQSNADVRGAATPG
jgi:hypothetical protein